MPITEPLMLSVYLVDIEGFRPIGGSIKRIVCQVPFMSWVSTKKVGPAFLIFGCLSLNDIRDFELGHYR